MYEQLILVRRCVSAGWSFVRCRGSTCAYMYVGGKYVGHLVAGSRRLHIWAAIFRLMATIYGLDNDMKSAQPTFSSSTVSMVGT